MDAVKLDTRNRWADAAIAAGAGAVVVATPTLALSGMFASQRYGETFLHALGRSAAVPLGAFGAPVVAGAFASRLVGGGGLASSASGAVAGAAAGAALGATLLHGPLQVGGPPMTRASSAALLAIAGAVFGGMSGAVSHMLREPG